MAGRFALLNQQFSQYHKDIVKYKEYIQGVLNNRETVRSSCKSEDSACQQQKIIMKHMDDLDKNIGKYGMLVEGKYLIDEIHSYTNYVKSIDEDLKGRDDKILQIYGKKNARDEHMTKGDFENLFAQQIR